MLPDVVPPVPASLASLLAVFGPLFTAPSLRTFHGLACGFLAQTGKRTVCGMLAGAGLSRAWSHDRAHRFFARARRSPIELGLAVAKLVVALLVPAGHEALEVKVYRGSPGFLEIAGRARGRMECWQKWSFPCGPPGQAGAAPPGWVLVHKRISRISVASGQIQARALGQGEKRGCMVELTEVHRHGEAWWTLGFEATGPPSLLRRELEAAATLVVAQALPDDIELDTDHSQSYATWLGRKPSAEPPLILNPCQAMTDEPPDGLAVRA
jgi:hypothetical protein